MAQIQVLVIIFIWLTLTCLQFTILSVGVFDDHKLVINRRVVTTIDSSTQGSESLLGVGGSMAGAVGHIAGAVQRSELEHHLRHIT